MTTRYTNEEWTSIIRQTQQGLAVSTAAVPYAPLGTVGFAHYFDHTLLKLDATGQQIDTLCAEARNYGFRVCV